MILATAELPDEAHDNTPLTSEKSFPTLWGARGKNPKLVQTAIPSQADWVFDGSQSQPSPPPATPRAGEQQKLFAGCGEVPGLVCAQKHGTGVTVTVVSEEPCLGLREMSSSQVCPVATSHVVLIDATYRADGGAIAGTGSVPEPRPVQSAALTQ